MQMPPLACVPSGLSVSLARQLHMYCKQSLLFRYKPKLYPDTRDMPDRTAHGDLVCDYSHRLRYQLFAKAMVSQFQFHRVQYRWIRQDLPAVFLVNNGYTEQSIECQLLTLYLCALVCFEAMWLYELTRQKRRLRLCNGTAVLCYTYIPVIYT